MPEACFYERYNTILKLWKVDQRISMNQAGLNEIQM